MVLTSVGTLAFHAERRVAVLERELLRFGTAMMVSFV